MNDVTRTLTLIKENLIQGIHQQAYISQTSVGTQTFKTDIVEEKEEFKLPDQAVPETSFSSAHEDGDTTKQILYSDTDELKEDVATQPRCGHVQPGNESSEKQKQSQCCNSTFDVKLLSNNSCLDEENLSLTQNSLKQLQTCKRGSTNTNSQPSGKQSSSLAKAGLKSDERRPQDSVYGKSYCFVSINYYTMELFKEKGRVMRKLLH